MSTFKDYLTESTKSYDYKIKIAGAPKDIDKDALEAALEISHGTQEMVLLFSGMLVVTLHLLLINGTILRFKETAQRSERILMGLV